MPVARELFKVVEKDERDQDQKIWELRFGGKFFGTPV